MKTYECWFLLATVLSPSLSFSFSKGDNIEYADTAIRYCQLAWDSTFFKESIHIDSATNSLSDTNCYYSRVLIQVGERGGSIQSGRSIDTTTNDTTVITYGTYHHGEGIFSQTENEPVFRTGNNARIGDTLFLLFDFAFPYSVSHSNIDSIPLNNYTILNSNGSPQQALQGSCFLYQNFFGQRTIDVTFSAQFGIYSIINHYTDTETACNDLFTKKLVSINSFPVAIANHNGIMLSKGLNVSKINKNHLLNGRIVDREKLSQKTQKRIRSITR